MTATSTLRPVFVETFPTPMEPATLYVSISYRICGHLCACGCGHEVITPLSPAQWSLTYDGESISLAPSIGNWALPCQAHYWIRRGEVRWSRQYSSAEIANNRERDRRHLIEAAGQETPGLLARLRGRWRLRMR
ncbi:DUF6527 family protein [Streptomyces avermitilis]|uniref:DUF6527 family protein n=1 Tax=Streptomyces avermitilis TaxID=33903 RepID=UPI00340406E4